jgi:RND family efflux transporter MFP subunit
VTRCRPAFRIGLPFAFAALAIAVSGCRRSAPPEAMAIGPVSVVTQAAQVDTLRTTIAGPGAVTPAAAADWSIFPPEAGRIAELPKAEGESVKPGDMLVRFEFANLEAEVAARQADVASATAHLDSVKNDLTRISAMFDRGYAPRNDFESAKNAVSQAQTDLARSKQLLDIANRAAERSVIKASFAGVVAKRFHAEGDLVNGSMTDPVLRVIDPTRLQVAMRVSLQQLTQIMPGQSATVVSADRPAGEAATVASRASPADPSATSAEIRLAFVNPSTLAIDAPVQAEIVIDQRPNVLVLPAASILKGENGATFVMMAGADGRAHRRDVRVGLMTHDRVEILSGVTTGDRVIVKGLDQILDGTAITIER